MDKQKVVWTVLVANILHIVVYNALMKYSSMKRPELQALQTYVESFLTRVYCDTKATSIPGVNLILEDTHHPTLLVNRASSILILFLENGFLTN